MKLVPTGTLRARFAAPAPPLTAHLARLATAVTDDHLDPALVWLAGELAALASEPVGEALDDDDTLATAVFAVACLLAQAEGSTRLGLGEASLLARIEHLCAAVAQAHGPQAPFPGARALYTRIRTLLGDRPPERSRLSRLVGAPDAYTPFVRVGDHVYTEQIYRRERRLIATLASRLGAPAVAHSPDEVAAAIGEVTARLPFELNEEQRAALGASTNHRLVVISGGPGTGKTTLVLSLLRVLTRLGTRPDRIALAAPTGKAAYRLWEAVHDAFAGIEASGPLPAPDAALRAGLPEARTLHRLLGYSARHDRFAHDATRPLDVDVVLVDEASMIDLAMMDALVAALRPNTRLILLGDAEQLPSVDAGAVFRDLIPAAAASTAHGLAATRLTTSNRMDVTRPDGLAIYTLARAINDGDPHAIRACLPPPDTTRPAFYGVHHVDPADTALDRFLETWFDAHLRQAAALLAEQRATRRDLRLHPDGRFDEAFLPYVEALLELHARARILCLTRRRQTGADALNRRLQAHHVAALGHTSPARFHVGDPVMMLRNDYDLGLFNGDQGIILNVHRTGLRGTPKCAVFPAADGTHTVVELDRLHHSLELSYAMTVHKSQGSQFHHLALILPTSDTPLLTRELLYTAVTRASNSVTLYGTAAMLLHGAARKIERSTGVHEGLFGEDGVTATH